MKSFPKFFIAFFLIVFILQLGLLLFLALAPNTSQAADSINFKPQVIQDLDYNFDSSDKTTGNIANLVRAIYKYAIGIVGILAAVVLMIGGLLWIVAGGSSAQIGEAKAWIGASLTGLLLALLSYLILATINPALVNLKTTGIQGIQKVEDNTLGCCQTDDLGKQCGMITASQCRGEWLGEKYRCGNDGVCSLTQDLDIKKDTCKENNGFTIGSIGDRDPESSKRTCTNICAGKSELMSNKSFFIVMKENKSVGGFCCLCEKPSNYCSEKGTNCAAVTGGQSGYCDGTGNCVTTKGNPDEWCGSQEKIGKCNKSICPISWITSGRSCTNSWCCP